MARPLAKLSFFATLLTAASAIAIPTPVAKDFVKKDVQCAAAAALAYVTPSPGANVITITRQGQPVSTCIPTAYACNADYQGCVTQYSTSSYNWYSTYIPCPTGLAYINSGDCTVTLPYSTGPAYSVATYTATTAGTYQLGGNYYEVDQAPAYIQYVYETGNSYASCQADDYFQWLYGGYGDQSYASGGYAQYGSGQAGYGGLAVLVTTCDQSGCQTEYQNWSLGYSYVVEEYVISGSFSGWCAGPGACVLNGFDSTFGSISITINVNIGGAVSTVTSFTTTVTATSTVTNTVIMSGSSTVSTVTTATDTAIVTATQSTTTTVGPTASSAPFNLQVVPAGTTKLRRRQSQGYVAVINGGFAVVQSITNAASFFLQGGSLFNTATTFAFASFTDISSQAAQIEVGASTTGVSTLFDLTGSTLALEWRNSQFTNSLARFCLQPNGELFGVYSGTVPAGCAQVFLVASPAAPTSSSSSSASSTNTGSSASSTSAGSSVTSSTVSSTINASSRSISGTVSSSGTASASSGSSVSASSSANTSSANSSVVSGTSTSASVSASATSSGAIVSSSSSATGVSSTSMSVSSSSSVPSTSVSASSSTSAPVTSSSSSASMTSQSSSSSASSSSSSSVAPACTAVDTTTNQFTNPGFESGALSPWTESSTSNTDVSTGVVASNARSGTYSYEVVISTTGNSGTVQQTLTTCSGRNYNGAIYVKGSTAGAGSCTITVSASGTGVATASPNTAYSQIPFSFTAAGTNTVIAFTFTCSGGSTATFFADDAVLVDA